MKFLNTNPKRQFREYKNFWAYGYSNYTDLEVIGFIENGINFIPKGQFAYVYIKDKKYFFMCDHLCTTNLYYNQDSVTSSFDQIRKVRENNTLDTVWHSQIELLKTHTVGPFTPYESIKRVEPDHYVTEVGSYMYHDSMNTPTVEPDYQLLKTYVSNFANRITESDPVVAFSGGKDSYLVAEVLRKYNKNPRLVKVHSENVRNMVDIKACEEFTKHGWNIEKYEIEGRKKYITNQFNHDFWRDGTFNVKQEAVRGKGTRAYSGELSAHTPKDQLLFSYITNIHKPKVEDIVKFWVSVNSSFLKERMMRGFDKEYSGEGYDYLLEYWTKKWNRLEGEDKIYRLFLQEHGSYRLWCESQDNKNTWFNMYADSDIFHQWLSYPQKYKIKKEHLKELALQIGGTDISWKYKSIGMSINK